MCKKEISIEDKSCDLHVTLYTDSTVKLDGYEFTVEQLQKSIYSQMNLFVISKLGNSILFVSHSQGFWVRLDDMGDVKVGVSSKYNSFVDGLCGYYNEHKNDDKRLPNGTFSISTVEFGDAWYRDGESKPKCEPNACSQREQDTAWELCNKIKDEIFTSCSKAINSDHFISKCLETACECLKSSNKSKEQVQTKCKCSILQNYVTECMASDESIHFDTWRDKFECPSNCPATLVHHDCYRRRCEPTCSSNQQDCPYLPGTCFSGCYCPEGTVRKGEKCIAISECKDCVCDGFGRSQYITYDRKNFTFDGNCTYLLSRDVKIPNTNAFQVYVSLAPCQQSSLTTEKNQHSCTQSLHILYGQHIIHLQRDTTTTNSIKTLVDGIEVKTMPHKSEWISIKEEKSKAINLNLLKSHVEVDAMLEDLSFSIKIPSIKYRNQVEGLCGNCNGDPNDDIIANTKYTNKIESPTDLNEILQTWVADEPALKLNKTCNSDVQVADDCVPLPPDEDPCLEILNQDTFGQCHLVVEALKYVSMCQIDMCKLGNSQKGACSHLSAYARECSRNGICVDWKKGVCAEKFECPNDMEYKPCGCHKTCGSLKDKKATLTAKCAEPIDGCFCRNEKFLNENGKCVSKRECLPCDDKDHFIGDKWHPDKCNECECNENGKVSCTKKQCSDQEICQLGYKKVIVDESGCCPVYKCLPEIIGSECQYKPLPKCALDQYTKAIVDANNCTTYVCECKPLNQCKQTKPRSLRVGEKLVDEKIGCCPTEKIVCDKSLCPPIPSHCAEAFHEIVRKEQQNIDYCCDEFECRPPKNLCIVKLNDKYVSKKIDEIWPSNEPCRKQKCAYDFNGLPKIVDEKEICPLTNCTIGFKLVIPTNKCCGECIQEKCIIDNKTFEVDTLWYSDDNCTSYKCTRLVNQFVVSSSHSTCPDVSDCPEDRKYFADCCQRCKHKIEDKCKYMRFIQK